MILGAEVLFAYFDRKHPRHWSVAGQIELTAGFEQLMVSPFVIAELERIVREQYGTAGWLAVLDELGSGAWTIGEVDAAHLSAVRERVEGGESLAEASVAVFGKGDS